MILKTFYRYYSDTWGVTANTFEITMPIKLPNDFRIYPFYRYHIQKQTSYFAEYQEHLSTDEFYTSDFDLSSFSSHKYGLGISYRIDKHQDSYKELDENGKQIKKDTPITRFNNKQKVGFFSRIFSIFKKKDKKRSTRKRKRRRN